MNTRRHSFVTHPLAAGTDIPIIQVLLGYCHINTTAGYAQVARTTSHQTQSPLDRLALKIAPSR